MERLARPHALPAPHADKRASLTAWLRDGLRLWRAHPLGVLMLGFVAIVVEALCQLVPGVGTVGSKLLTPFASACALVMLDARVRRGAYAPGAALAHVLRRARAVLGIALIGLGVFAFQCGTAAGLGGAAQAFALATGDMAALRFERMPFALVLASGALPAMALVFTVPRVLLGGMGLRAALADNARLLLRHAPASAGFAALSAALVGSLVFAPWVALVMLPMSLCTVYAAYRDVDRRNAR